MHMADALLSTTVATTMYVCSTVATGYSVKKVKKEQEEKKVPVMGVMGAFVFATQMINFTIPGTGSSGHLCGGMLLSAILGPHAGFLTMIGVLLVQCLLFADGGLIALGANVWNMAFYGCFVGGMFIWKTCMKRGMSRKKIILASIIGGILTLQLGAFSVTIETSLSGITELPFAVFLATMQPIHLVIGLVEGVITASVLVFIYEARPQLLWGYSETKLGQKNSGKCTDKKMIAIFAVLTILIGGVLSLIASANPDGLEWSIERITGQTQLQATSTIHQVVEKIQRATAVFPDYSVNNASATLGTSVSGIVGAIVVVGLCVGGCYLLKLVRRKKQ